MNQKTDIKEYEVKVLEFDKEFVIKKLRDLGAKEEEEVLMRRWVFDMESKDAEWIRLRTNGNKATISYKHKYHNTSEMGLTEEIEIVIDVSEFDKAAEIFQRMPFPRIFYQENKRHLFKLEKYEISIDTWPKLEPFLEVEAASKEEVHQALELLGLKGKDVGDKDVLHIYKEQGLDPHSQKELKFD